MTELIDVLTIWHTRLSSANDILKSSGTMNPSFQRFCEIAQQIAETRGTNAKTAIFESYLKDLSESNDNPDALLNLATQFIGEGAFSTVSGKRASIGPRTIATCAASFCEIDYELVFRPSRIATGSASETIEKLMENLDVARAKRNPSQPSLTEIANICEEIANLRKRIEKEEALIRAWTQLTPLEIKYFLRILGGGSLRIGFEARSILNSIALAFQKDIEPVRYAHMITGSLGKTAVMARNNTLDDASFRLFNPVAFMLASPVESRVVDTISEYIAEEKFDGMRCQAHISRQKVSLYSRDLNDISDTFPDLCDTLKIASADEDFVETVLDGEICVYFDDRIQPFQMLQKRMGVKKPSAKLLKQFPVIFVAYDILYTNGTPLFDVPLGLRRARLEEFCKKWDIRLVNQFPLKDTSDVETLFKMAIAHGNEGLILKHRDSVYEFGQRRKSWLKVKQPGGSLDTVIIYATAGSGKRGGTYSDFTLGVRTGDDQRFDQDFVPIGKAYGGYTDEELKRLNVAIKPLIREKFGPTLSLEPQIVVEIEFDEIQINKRTKAGYTLRFPRFRAIRWDKGPHDADTLQEVERLYNEKMSRDRLPQTENPSFL